MEDENADLNTVDKNENSIYHIATMFDNGEALMHLLDTYTNDKIYSKNMLDDTILHCACRNGNVAMVKQILSKLYETNASLDSFLLTKNKEGETCFHICCSNGYSNIVEYFLKERKLNQFLEVLDNNSNTALHLATLNGHSGIVKCLIEHGADVNVKNEDDISPLDFSCRKGFFEISKNIIASQEASQSNDHQQLMGAGDYPLHVACYEGAHEVVKLLLLKGAVIDRLNKENKNCLDIAISRGHKEVIRVLLNDANWLKLIRINNSAKPGEEEDPEAEKQPCELEAANASEKLLENPQLVALFDAKMWEMLKIVLDKCVILDEYENEREIDFTILDPPLVTVAKHPLMLIACSGQENLLQHRAIRTLLHLKWRFIPRSVFYFNIFFYLIFLLFFSLFTIELSELTAKFKALQVTESQARNMSLLNSLVARGDYMFFAVGRPRTALVLMLAAQVCFQIFMEILQILFIDR